MANYADLKKAISDVIKANGAQQITGQVLQNTLLSIVSTIGANYTFAGIATPQTNPRTPDQNVFYIAGEGTYAYFSGLTIDVGQLGILKYNGTWKKEVLEIGAGGGNMILDWNTDKATTRKQVLMKNRKPGVQISYNEPGKGWVNEQFIGAKIDDNVWISSFFWVKVDNNIIPTEDFSEIDLVWEEGKRLFNGAVQNDPLYKISQYIPIEEGTIINLSAETSTYGVSPITLYINSYRPDSKPGYNGRLVLTNGKFVSYKYMIPKGIVGFRICTLVNSKGKVLISKDKISNIDLLVDKHHKALDYKDKLMIFTQTIKGSDYPQKRETPILLNGNLYTIKLKSDNSKILNNWQLWGKTEDSQTRIRSLNNTDLNETLEFEYKPTEDIYSLGCGYGGSQASDLNITYEVFVGDSKRIHDLEKKVFDMNLSLSEANKALTTVNYTEAIEDYYIDNSYLGKDRSDWITADGFEGKEYSVTEGEKILISGSAKAGAYNVYSFVNAAKKFVSGKNGGYGITIIKEETVVPKGAVAVRVMNDKSRNLDGGIQVYRSDALGKSVAYSNIKNQDVTFDFDDFYKLGTVKNDSYNFEEEIIGLIVAGQSNTDGRIPNKDFPAKGTIDTTDDITFIKQIENCKFMKGDTEATYSEPSKNFAARDNKNTWAFDDIVYNCIDNHLKKNGGAKDFYVCKQSRGNTSIQMRYQTSFSAEIYKFKEKKWYSQLYHMKLLVERALELNPNIKFKAILWHQGEGDYQNKYDGTYYVDMGRMIYWIRGLVGNPRLPFIFGTVPKNSKQFGEHVYNDMKKIAENINDVYMIELPDCENWVQDGMDIHFGAKEATKFGIDVFKILRDRLKIFGNN